MKPKITKSMIFHRIWHCIGNGVQGTATSPRWAYFDYIEELKRRGGA